VSRRHQILASAGFKVDDFPTQEKAFATAEEMAVENATAFEFVHEKIDHANPMLVKFKFVVSQSTKRSWTSTDKTEIAGTMEPKSKKALEDMGQVAKMLAGESSAGSSGDATGVKVESAVFVELSKTVGACRSYANVSCILSNIRLLVHKYLCIWDF
jgi:hypothetical protein